MNHRIDDCVSDVRKAINRPALEGDVKPAFYSGVPIFVELPYRLRPEELDELRSILREGGVETEPVVNGQVLTTSAGFDLICRKAS